MERYSIKNWSADDRPREKLLHKGINSLSNAELIAILIGSGNKHESAVDLSKRILHSLKNNLNDLGKLTINELQSFNGIGQAKAISIKAALELGKRRKFEEIIEKEIISSSTDVFNYFHPLLGELPHEEFWIILANRANKIINHCKISQGGITGTVADIKIIMKHAINNNATSIILCHNHPSGNTQPSNADIKLTKRLIEAGKIMEISILDHIIIGDKKYYSFADEGILEC